MREMSYYNSFWYRFTLPIKRWWFKYLLSKDKLIKVDDRHRAIGKTHMMIDKAIKYDIPILAGSQKHVDLITDLIRKRKGKVKVYGLAKNFTIHIKGKKLPNGVLIDESVEPEMIEEVIANDIRIRGGFIQNYGSGK